MSFKVGDLVRSKEDYGALVHGAVYEIVGVIKFSGGDLVQVRQYCAKSKRRYLSYSNDYYARRFNPYKEGDWLDNLELG